MHYLTRHLEAQTEIAHGTDLLRKGDRFYATDVDADYYLKHKKVSEVNEEPKPFSVPQPSSNPTTNLKAEGKTRAKPGPKPKAPVQPPADTMPAESMLTTSRDLPGPAQETPPADHAKTEAA